MAPQDAGQKFDHVVSVMFENRSFDNLLGHLYEPGEVASFEGVFGRDLSNPIPIYAPGADRGVVPLHVATSMDWTRAKSTTVEASGVIDAEARTGRAHEHRPMRIN